MLDPFEALAGDMPSLKHDVLERQSFSLAHAKHVSQSSTRLQARS
jgi:hypothetical protein